MIAINKPLDGYEFETPQELARALADVLELHPHILAPTHDTTGRGLDGELKNYQERDSVRFCAVGTIRRMTHGVMRDEEAFHPRTYAKELLGNQLIEAVQVQLARDRVMRPGMVLGEWFERKKPHADEFAYYLRRTADRLDKRDRKLREAEPEPLLATNFRCMEVGEMVAAD